MNYQDLIHILGTYTPEQLQQTVTVACLETEEYRAVVAVYTTDEEDNDVLDNGHIVLALN